MCTYNDITPEGMAIMKRLHDMMADHTTPRATILQYLHDHHCRIECQEASEAALILLYHDAIHRMNAEDRPFTDNCVGDSEYWDWLGNGLDCHITA